MSQGPVPGPPSDDPSSEQGADRSDVGDGDVGDVGIPDGGVPDGGPAVGGSAEGGADGIENRVIATTTRRPVAVSMVTIAIFVFGLVSLRLLPMNLMPDIAQPRITVRTSYPGAAPDDVEDRVSQRLEEALSVVRGLQSIESVSRAESSDVILELGWDADIGNVVQDVRERIDQTRLPDDVEAPTILRYDPTLEPVLRLALTGERDLTKLRRVAEDEIERKIESTPGVAAVKVRGGFEREIRIAVDEQKVRARRLDLQTIALRLQEENLDQASGLIKEGEVAYLVRTRNEFRSLGEIRRLPLRRDGASTIRVSDVAEVTETRRDLEVITRVDGRASVEIEIFREADANIVDLARRVRSRIYGTAAEQKKFDAFKKQELEQQTASVRNGSESDDAIDSDSAVDSDFSTPSANGSEAKAKTVLRPEFVVAQLPDGVELELLADRSTFIENAISELLVTALVGGVLAVLVLFLFLGRLSFTAIVAVSIPFSVVATFAPMYAGDVSLNVMSLGGLALGIGMLVDSSIVVLESIFRRREEGSSAIQAAIVGASDVGGAVFASTLTTIAVFFPIIFVEGIAGRLFRDQATTVVLSLLASLIVSLTLIPALAARLTGSILASQQTGENQPSVLGPVTRIRQRYERWRARPFGLRLASLVLLPFTLVAVVVDAVVWLSARVFFGVAFFGRRGFLVSGIALGVLVRPVLKGFELLYGSLENGYVRLLKLALARRVMIALFAAIGVCLAVYIGRDLGTELIPVVAQGELDVNVRYPIGTPIEETSRRLEAFELELTGLDSVEQVATRVGVDADDVEESGQGEHTAKLRVRIAPGPESIARREASAIREIESVLADAHDLEFEIERLNLFAIRAPVEIEIYGPDLVQLEKTTRDIESALQQCASVTGVRSMLAPGNPEYHLVPDRDTLMRNGLTSQDLSGTLRRMNLGEVATRLRDVDERIDIRVRLAEGDRNSIDRLTSARVNTPSGQSFRIRDLVSDLSVRAGPSEIRRIDQRRASVVSADVRGLDLGGATREVERAIAPIVAELPSQFRVSIGGQVEESDRSLRSMALALLLAVFLVYVVMASQFESFLQPFVILFTIPLAAIGVVVALALTKTSLSIPSAIGLVVLAGIVVNNAIVLIDQINRLRQSNVPALQAIVEAGRRRLRPIVMTTATTVLAMIPLTGLLTGLDLPGFGGEGVELRAPMAITVIGGLLSSTLLTLVVIPVLYASLTGTRAETAS